jgi:hypothetical protein
VSDRPPLSVISYGGGVQSTALLVLAARGEIHVDAALFANVGDDSEHPDTLRYVREIAQPYGAAEDVPVHVLDRRTRTGDVETLMGRLSKVGSRSLPIPVRMSNGAPGMRSCTIDFKVRVIAKWLKAHGASRKHPASVNIGFSFDEAIRMGAGTTRPYERLAYPLIDRRLTREDCKRIIERAGLPVPPKSSCFFCPFHRPSMWARMRRDEPLLFERSAALEDMLNARRDVLGKDHVWLTRFAKPLREAVQSEQAGLDFGTGPGETCDEGYCWT